VTIEEDEEPNELPTEVDVANVSTEEPLFFKRKVWMSTTTINQLQRTFQR
jgi:hypothetical protein